MKADSLIIIPTYNEKENISNIIHVILGIEEHKFDVLVIDDNSPDGTGAIVDGIIAEEPERVHIIKRSGKLGLGTAYIEGFKWALQHDYSYVIEMDADFSHRPQDLIPLQRACGEEGADVSIGSRYLTGLNVVNWPLGRILMSYFASKYVRFITRMKINDTTAGFVCYKREVLDAIHFDMVKFKGYAFQIEMKFTAYKMGFKLVEVPIVFVNRELGTSKMSGGIFSEALFGVIKLKWSSWFNKKKFTRRTASDSSTKEA